MVLNIHDIVGICFVTKITIFTKKRDSKSSVYVTYYLFGQLRVSYKKVFRYSKISNSIVKVQNQPI